MWKAMQPRMRTDNEPLIDLRSDTVTRPTPAMREAMAAAEVGDDVFGDDPTANGLQERAAEIFGRDAGLFVPSGSMGNLICLRCHADAGDEAIVEARSHIYNFEMGGISAIAGIVPRVVPGRGGILEPADVEAAVQTSPGFRSRTRLLCIENTHNVAGGAVYPTERVRELCDLAHRFEIRVHLDGARIFNAATALGQSVREITSGFDSISFCFSKGLGAPIGSMILGTREFIEEARRFRKLLGGGMRQVGVIAAAARVALEESPSRLHEDHARASRLAEAIDGIPTLEIDAGSVRTNIVIFGIAKTGMNSLRFLESLREEGVAAVPMGKHHVRMVTHRDVDDAGIEHAIEALGRVAGPPGDGGTALIG